MRPRRRRLLQAAAVLAALFLLIQLIPYGHDHGAPATTKRASFPASARALVAGACGDCHSNQTRWPWYSNVAPVSLLVVNDVKGGREHLNFSQWDRPQPSLGEVLESVREGEMPPLQYKVIHSGGRLSASERRQLEDAMRKAYASDPPPQRRGG
jgi:Haem-binding domain